LITLADLSQFFSILSDLNFFIGVPSQALQIIFQMQSPEEEHPKKSNKENTFFEL
jgi:hypothetical protein